MPFLQGTAELPAAIINSTGTILRFRRTQRAFLPSVDVDVNIHMPDGRKIPGVFTSTAAFPYVRGPEVRRWIQGWLRPGETREVTLRSVRDGVELVFVTAGSDARRRPQARSASEGHPFRRRQAADEKDLRTLGAGPAAPKNGH